MHAALAAFAVLRFGLTLELGPEFDSNANRAEVYPQASATLPSPVASFLLRSTAAARLAWTSGRNTLRLGATGGGKLFFADAAQTQDVFVGQLTAEDALRAAGPLLLGAGGDYYDATQWNACPDVNMLPDTACHRDFRSLGGRLSALLVDDKYDLALVGGVREFDWKPDDALSFAGLYAGATASAHLRSGPPEEESEWDLAASGRIEPRWYHGPALTGPNDDGAKDTALRRDVDVIGSLSVTHVGKLLAAVAYTIDFDRSTSYGQSYLRHVVALKLAFDLPFGVTATTRLQLVFMSYPEPSPLATGQGVPPLSIDDENRNGVLVDLDRPIGAGFSASARWSFYKNAAGALVDYTRHVVYLGLSYRLR